MISDNKYFENIEYLHSANTNIEDKKDLKGKNNVANFTFKGIEIVDVLVEDISLHGFPKIKGGLTKNLKGKFNLMNKLVSLIQTITFI